MSIKKIEDIFGLNKELTILIIFSSIILFIAMFIKIIKPSEKKHWQIISNGEYYLTTDPIISGECVYFTDDYGLYRKICGIYKIKSI